MSDDDKSGSELDIFEGLGKKSSVRSSVAPPPPPGAAGSEARQVAAPPQPVEVKKTLLGIAAPLSPNSSVAPARPSRPPMPPSSSTITAARPSQPAPRPSQTPDAPPPPPKRGSLPNLQAATPAVVKAANPDAATEPVATGAKLDMDWDDDNEATHVYDKDKDKPGDKPAESTLDDSKELETAPVPIAKARPSTTPPPPPPASQSMRTAGSVSAPPPPPPSAMPSTRPSAPPSSTGMRSAPPPLPPTPSSLEAALENQTTTQPLPPTPSRPPSLPPPGANLAVARTPSVPPPAPPSALPIESQMTSRSMEATQMVRRSRSNKGLLAVLFVVVAIAAGFAVMLVIPRSGTLAINVIDPRGSIPQVEVLVDGKKVCDATPCTQEVAAGVHRVQVHTGSGYQPVAPKVVNVEGNAQVDFMLNPTSGSSGSSTAQGTGIKVSGAQPGFRLAVDGKEIGALPQEVRDLAPGEHKIKITGPQGSEDRYAAIEKTVTVSKDEMVDLGSLSLKVVKGKITILPGTPGAKVYIVMGSDRRVLPELPKAVDIDATKTYTLEAEKSGYNDFSQVITFEDGQAEKSITVNLEPKSAKPATGAVAAAPKAESAPKAEPKEEPKSEPAPKEEVKAEPKSEATGEATLKINSVPASSVILDGKPIGQTPLPSVKVSAGTHNIRFVNPEQSLQKQISVTVKAGETKAAFAKLKE